MNKEKRIAYFEKIREKNPYGSMEVWYKNRRQKLSVYEIDLDYLIYNPYNGRIASLVKSYERQTGNELDPTKPNDIRIIEEFLWKSNIPSNKATKKSIKEQGQLKYGIVTKDGVIIDGNRRLLILNQIYKEEKESPKYFRAVVLEETLDENPKEIMRLETTYQMGEDAKVDYNAIEKYLKCKDLINVGFSKDEIAKMMGETTSQITEYLSIMELMNEYLDKLGYAGIYTRLDKTEGTFVDLNNYLKRYKGGKSKIIQWKYDDTDLNDLKLIYFDNIRAIYNRGKSTGSESGDSKDYRFIGQTSKKGSFFTNENIWKRFRDRHFEIIEPITIKESSIDELKENNPGLSLDRLLKNRDAAWAKKVDPNLKKNMGLGREALDNINKQNAPLELLESAKAKIESINIDVKAFLEDSNVLDVVCEINRLTYDFKKIIKKHNKNH